MNFNLNMISIRYSINARFIGSKEKSMKFYLISQECNKMFQASFRTEKLLAREVTIFPEKN